MAIKKSNITGGHHRRQMSSPVTANVPTIMLIEHTFSEAVGSGDILELCYLPPYCRVLDAEVMTVGTGATTFDIGFMSGTPDSDDPARTSGDELFDGATPTTATRAAIADLVGLGKQDTARSIGVKPSANVAASATTKLYLKLTYATGS